MQMQQLPPTREFLREILSDYATGEMYVMFSFDYDHNILTGMSIGTENLNLNHFLKYLRKNGIPILSAQESPVIDELKENMKWWDLLFMKHSTEN